MSDAFQDWARVVREKAIEAMARAAHDVDWREGHYDQLPNDAPMKAYSRQCATAALDALLAELPGLGLQVVPVVATDGMIECEEDDFDSRRALEMRLFSAEAWAGMVAAAPNVLGRVEQ